MLIRNVPSNAIDALECFAAAEQTRLEVSCVTPRRSGSIEVRCVLRYDDDLDPRELTRRKSASGRRTVGVTWAAHRGFMMRLFDAFPDAVIVSAIATYRGKQDFLARHGATYNHNAGSRVDSVKFGAL